MSLFIGIDLGTSAVKLLLVDEKGTIRGSVTKAYPLRFPQPGWSEQDPADWWKAVQHGILQLTEHVDKSEIRGIGCGGQMHGLVALDENDAVIRPAILWNDGRTAEETEYLNTVVGKEKLSALTANIAFAGFTAPKLLWMRNHEPENFARIKKIMLPKDYINYRLTGVHACDYSDASGMLLLDVAHKCWSKEMLEICGVSEAQMPKLFESYEVIGPIQGFVSGALGLPRDCRVVAGAGDNAAAAVGTGVVGEGGCNLSLGTSGTIFISSEHFGVDPNNALHAFAHADGGYHLMGCMLSAASCNKWFCDEILKSTDYAAEQAEISDERLGRNRVFFLPYLMGERSPINDTDARGTFVGMDRILRVEKYDPDDGIACVILADGKRDKYSEGVDATDGSLVTNVGNYGVLYRIEANSRDKTRFFLSPMGGWFAGVVRVEAGAGDTRFFSVPEGTLMFGEKSVHPLFDENGVTTLLPSADLSPLGEYRSDPPVFFEMSPPGASNLPVLFILAPEDIKLAEDAS